MIFKKKKLCIFKLNEYNFGLYPDLGGKKILKDYFHKISFLKESGSTSIWVKLLNLGMLSLFLTFNWFSNKREFKFLMINNRIMQVKKDTVQFVQLVQLLGKQLK
ncbi:unnamed protein product [Rhizophagus irregularis]|uniref:Uncharacterized protein n=1 Tax=Rhizophagus irregularis TaxID=588596 RepID=A0A916EF20_9GLOM|nr:unnamed protein product [Rhizophagus irregularis]